MASGDSVPGEPAGGCVAISDLTLNSHIHAEFYWLLVGHQSKFTFEERGCRHPPTPPLPILNVRNVKAFTQPYRSWSHLELTPAQYPFTEMSYLSVVPRAPSNPVFSLLSKNSRREGGGEGKEGNVWLPPGTPWPVKFQCPRSELAFKASTPQP